MADQGRAQPAAGAVMDAAAIQLLVQQAVQAAIGAIQQQQQPAPQQQQQQAAAPAFALVPGDGNANVPWNFSTGDGLKLFQAATRPLETKYDGSMDKLQYFLDAIQHRAETYGMAEVLQVNVAAQTRTYCTITKPWQLMTLGNLVRQWQRKLLHMRTTNIGR